MVFLTGLGLVTPLGSDVEQSWRALLAGRFLRDHAPAAGEIAGERSRVTALSLRAARQAAAEAGWSASLLADESTALVVGTSKGPIVDWIGADAAPPHGMGFPPVETGAANRGVLDIHNNRHGRDTHATTRYPAGLGLAATAAEVAEALGMRDGPRITLAGACASGLHALARGAMMIRAGEARRVLVVAAEASLHPLFASSFQRLGVLAPKGAGCRPFDANRGGFVISEAAAAVCLETGETQRAILRLERARIASDPLHLTRPDEQGKVLGVVLQDILAGRPVDLVHAHGTGTVLNDAAELAAIERALGSLSRAEGGLAPPLLYSHKGALGHSLGAAGLVAVVINGLCHRHGVVPGNVRSDDPLAAAHVRIHRSAIVRPIGRSVVLAAGFGGALAVAALSSR